MVQMMPKEKIKWFWATGVVPGTIFDAFDDQEVKQLAWSHREGNELRIGDLKRRRKHKHKVRKPGHVEKTD